MSRILLRMIFLTLLAMRAIVEAQVLPEPVGELPNDVAAFQQSISDLASPEYARRQRAAETLKNSSAEQIVQLGQVITSNPDNEVVRRVIEILEASYQQPEREAFGVAAASEVIEFAAKSDRWFVAEAARDILKRHWKRRVELAVMELVRLGASLSPKDPTELWKTSQDLDHMPFRRRDGIRSDQLQIFVKDSWPKGPRGMELLRRLEALASDRFLRETGDIIIILVEGQPLSVEEIAILKGIFGDAPLQERGKVSLGIQPEGLSSDPGVTVSAVKPESSADMAGIRSGDVITAFNGENVPDFDALVTILRKCSVGDVITLRVTKYNNTGVRENVDVAVTLKEWQ